MKIAIDCGANVGIVTKKLCKKYDKVYAFEPNPNAFKRLSENLSSFENVELINSAVVGPSLPEKVDIYFDKRSKGDLETKIKYSQATSIMRKKRNISIDDKTTVNAVNFCEFVKSFEHIDYIKMDIEGAEYEILIELIKSGLMDRIGKLDVELHAIRAPETFGKEHQKYEKIKKQFNITNIGVHH